MSTPRMHSMLLVALGASLVSTMIGCAPAGQAPPDDETLAVTHDAVFANGNFEAGTANTPPPSWTVTPYLNTGVTLTTPASRADLQLQPGGAAQTFTWTGAAESQIDPTLGAAASLRWPKYGNGVAVVNTPGVNKNTNALKQSMTIGVADVDPIDGKVHVRFTVAPVLENPSHPAQQQPYYFVSLRNTTKGTSLYQDYNASAQPGVPWKTIGTTYYTDWQLVDIAPGSAALDIGDNVELEIIAAGCSPGGHFGRVYVDGVGSVIPGLFVSATGPASANAGSDIPYTIAYHNGGTGGSTATVITFVTPPSTTFQSVSGATCTTPAVGFAGTVTCTLGSVAAGASGNFTVTVTIDPLAVGKITNGDYAISAAGVSPLIGPKVYTTITNGVIYADLAVSMTDGAAGVAWGQPVTYTIVASNAGPSAVTNATLGDAMPPQLTGVTWTCAPSAGASCAASGVGSISDSTLSLPVGSTATYTVHANVVAGSGNGSVTNVVTVNLPPGASDPDNTSNAAADTDSIGSLRTLTVNKAGTGAGTVGSVPAAIACDASCSSDSATFLDGSPVLLNAVAQAGDTFVGWSGACSGTGTCSLTMTADTSVTATFTSPLAGNGVVCASGSVCLSGQCIDGVCCNTACGNGAADCQACNVAASVGTCTPMPTSTFCRASSGVCDVADHCDGTNPSCPVDAKVSAGTVCRASAGVCDAAEACDGGSSACPIDTLIPAGAVCRASAGLCDVSEACTGSSPACPGDTLVAGGAVCRASAGLATFPKRARAARPRVRATPSSQAAPSAARRLAFATFPKRARAAHRPVRVTPSSQAAPSAARRLGLATFPKRAQAARPPAQAMGLPRAPSSAARRLGPATFPKRAPAARPPAQAMGLPRPPSSAAPLPASATSVRIAMAHPPPARSTRSSRRARSAARRAAPPRWRSRLRPARAATRLAR